MVPRSNALVYELLLLLRPADVCGDELRHLDVVSEDVEWHLNALSDGNELILRSVLQLGVVHHRQVVL